MKQDNDRHVQTINSDDETEIYEHNDDYYDVYNDYWLTDIRINNILREKTRTMVNTEINAIGLTSLVGLLTPYLGKYIIRFAKGQLSGYAERKIKEQLETFIEKYFKTPLVSAAAQFILQVLKQNWKFIDTNQSMKNIISNLFNKVTSKT